MLVVECGLQRLGKPICVHSFPDIGEFGVVLGEAFHYVGRNSCLDRVIAAGQKLGLELFFSVHQVVVAQVRHVNGAHEFVGNLELSRGRSNGCDDNDSVRSAGAVDCGGRRVLQYCHVLDALRVHVVEFLHGNLESVENEYREIRIVLEVRLAEVFHIQFLGAHSGLSADVHLRERIRVGTACVVLLDAERRVEILDGLDDIGLGGLEKLFLVDGHRVAGEALFPDVRISGHDRGLDFGHVFGQLHVDPAVAGPCNLLAHHSDAAEHEECLLPVLVRRDLQAVFSFRVRHRSDGDIVLQINYHSGKRLAAHVSDPAGDWYLALGQCVETRGKKQNQHAGGTDDASRQSVTCLLHISRVDE